MSDLSRSSGPNEAGGWPSTSVVIPAYRSWTTLPLVLDALSYQMAGRSDREVIVVESSADGRAHLLPDRWPWAQIVSLDRRASAGKARNIGARAARGARLAFLDADAVPCPDWLDELERALTPAVDLVGGAFRNGCPRNALAAASHILDLLEWTPPRPDPLLHAAGGNLLVRREVLEAARGFAEETNCEDTLLTLPIGQRGALAFAPRAVVRHTAPRKLRDFLGAQYERGRGFHTVCRLSDFPAGQAVREGRLGLTLLYRVHGLGYRLLLQRREIARALILAPLIGLGLVAWLLGVRKAVAEAAAIGLPPDGAPASERVTGATPGRRPRAI